MWVVGPFSDRTGRLGRYVDVEGAVGLVRHRLWSENGRFATSPM